ncbi:MAG: formimidoylglutamase [Oligoflexia bacterium]|nr:formimidoylglutamase [Oligoflexia bacterium]
MNLINLKNTLTKESNMNDPRLKDIFKIVDSLTPDIKNSFVLTGYADDQGVKLNGGRVGAAYGPDEIRKILYKMTPSLESKNKHSFFDIGNLANFDSLDQRHENAKEIVLKALSQNNKVITMGGGHDYGYPDMAAFCMWCKKNGKRPYIINFDAHLDVRPNNNGNNSGTPFYRLLKEFSNIDFLEVGIQDWCNAQAHYDWVKSKGAKILTLDEILNSKLSFEKLMFTKYLKNFNSKKHELAASIDMDAFSSAFCPGASQVFPTGLTSNDFYIFWKNLVIKYQPKLSGIYEFNPTYDQDFRGAKLAALTIHQFLFKSKN